MGYLNKSQIEFLWGYALERGNLKLGVYHELADAHGADRVEAMRLAVLAMKEIVGESPQRSEDLPAPSSWPFPNGVKPLLDKMVHENPEGGSFR